MERDKDGKPLKRYFVDFYDMFDGWGTPGWYGEGFNSLDDAKKLADEKMKTLDDANKRCGEHYGVIDIVTGMEVYCTQTRGSEL
jgi:hypothetical protein